MELRQLKTFVAAAQLESFSGAAQRLGYSQSAVDGADASFGGRTGGEAF